MINWEEVAKQFLHPTQVMILEDLDREQEPVSPKRMAERQDQPLGNLAYHMRKLLHMGLLDLVKTEPRRGAVEHFYTIHERGKHQDEKEN